MGGGADHAGSAQAGAGRNPGRHPLLWRAPSLWSQRQSGPPSTAASGCWWVRQSTPPASPFAVFCQETGFATLVGSPTGGDGIGALDPVFLQLPNSGILVQFTMMFGLNGDGSSSEETGTTPDILSPAGEPALVTALRAMEGAA